MKKKKKTSTIYFTLASSLTIVTCIFATYQWITYENNPMNSAPAYVTLIYSIPLILIIILLLILGIIFHKKV
jgi:hypothetical protein